jgi:hypothetical protein
MRDIGANTLRYRFNFHFFLLKRKFECRSFDEEDQILKDIATALTEQMNNLVSADEILREDSNATKVIMKYLKFLEARESYLVPLIHPFIEEINSNPHMYEIDLDNVKASAANFQNVIRLSIRLFYVLFSSADKMPFATRFAFSSVSAN